VQEGEAFAESFAGVQGAQGSRFFPPAVLRAEPRRFREGEAPAEPRLSIEIPFSQLFSLSPEERTESATAP